MKSINKMIRSKDYSSCTLDNLPQDKLPLSLTGSQSFDKILSQIRMYSLLSQLLESVDADVSSHRTFKWKKIVTSPLVRDYLV